MKNLQYPASSQKETLLFDFIILKLDKYLRLLEIISLEKNTVCGYGGIVIEKKNIQETIPMIKKMVNGKNGIKPV